MSDDTMTEKEIAVYTAMIELNKELGDRILEFTEKHTAEGDPPQVFMTAAITDLLAQVIYVVSDNEQHAFSLMRTVASQAMQAVLAQHGKDSDNATNDTPVSH